MADVFDGPHATPKTVEAGPIFLGISALQDGAVNLSETRHVTEDDFKKWTRRVRPTAGDIVFSYETRLGQAAIIPEGLECCLGRRMGLVRFRDGQVIPRFFLYQYLSPQFRAFLDANTVRGATVDRISIRDFPTFPIDLPPFSEQQRIVTILDDAFAGLATAAANAEANLKNSQELFRSYLSRAFTNEGKWKEKHLGETCVVERGSSPRPIKNFLTNSADGVNWVKIGDTKGVTKFIQATKEKITKKGAQSSRRVEPGDFILTNSMSFGRPYIMATSGYIHDGWFVLRLGEGIHRDYLYYLLVSELVQRQFRRLAAGAIVLNISSDLVKRAILPVPPLDQQKRLAGEIELYSAETERLQAVYEKKLIALAELKQVILQKAFSGELPSLSSQVINEAAE
ncbi:restriction endonuclease subunit S [Bradyrhizobium sp. JR3.5]